MTIKVTVTDPESGEDLVLAEGDLDISVTETDGGYYFEPVAVNTEILQKNEDESLQDEMGIGSYYDAISPLTRQVVKTMVGWIYDEVQEDYESISGLYGFPRVDTAGVIVQATDEEGNELDPKLDEETAATALTPTV